MRQQEFFLSVMKDRAFHRSWALRSLNDSFDQATIVIDLQEARESDYPYATKSSALGEARLRFEIILQKGPVSNAAFPYARTKPRLFEQLGVKYDVFDPFSMPSVRDVNQAIRCLNHCRIRIFSRSVFQNHRGSPMLAIR